MDWSREGQFVWDILEARKIDDVAFNYITEKVCTLLPSRFFYDGLVDSEKGKEYQGYIEFLVQESRASHKKADMLRLKEFVMQYEDWLEKQVSVKRKLLFFNFLQMEERDKRIDVCILMVENKLTRYIYSNTYYEQHNGTYKGKFTRLDLKKNEEERIALIKKEVVAENIKKYRELHNLSKAEFCFIVLADKKMVSDWEKGSVLPSLEELLTLASWLDIKLGNFFETEVERKLREERERIENEENEEDEW